MRVCSECEAQAADSVQFCPNDGTRMNYVQTIPPPGSGDPLIGRVVDNRYKVDKAIGEGGMGVVYLATHNVLGKKFALKVLRAEMAKNEEVVQRFQQEAQSATSIGHANIIDISDFGKLPDGSVYFVMEFLDGQALTDALAEGPMPQARAIPILKQIASALDAAHARGIVHRDLKPDNIYLVNQAGTSDFVKVLDFGIAKVGGQSSKLTKTGMIFGTPHYMSPEQASGQSVDKRTDVYAVGVIMYEMLTGHLPFDGDSFMTILSAHMFQPPPPATLPSGQSLGPIEAVVMRALAKKPEERYASMADLAVDLERVRKGDQPTVPPPSAHEPVLAHKFAARTPVQSPTGMDLVPAGNNRKLLVGVGIAAAVLVVGGLAFAFGGSSETPPAAMVNPPTQTQSTTQPSTPSIPSPSAPTVQPNVGADPPLRPAVIQIATEPSLATIEREDGVTVGNTPFTIPRPESGETIYVIKLSGYEEQRVVVTPLSEDISLQLEAIRRRGSSAGGSGSGTRPRPVPQGGSELVNPFSK